MTIFKKYDIRGTYPHELNKKTAFSIIKMLDGGKIILGHDGRKDSIALTRAVVKKFKNIVNLGHVSVSLVSFALHQIKASAGVMITASHLAKKYTGFKIFNKNGLPINFKKFKKKVF